MVSTETPATRVPDDERLAAAAAYVLGAIPALLNLDPYINFIGPIVTKNIADRLTVIALVGIIVLWFATQAPARGFVRAHITQMCIVVFVTGIAGWLAPSHAMLGTGLGPALLGVLALLGMLSLGAMAWMGMPPSLPWIGRRTRRWGRYDRRENT